MIKMPWRQGGQSPLAIGPFNSPSDENANKLSFMIESGRLRYHLKGDSSLPNMYGASLGPLPDGDLFPKTPISSWTDNVASKLANCMGQRVSNQGSAAGIPRLGVFSGFSLEMEVAGLDINNESVESFMGQLAKICLVDSQPEAAEVGHGLGAVDFPGVSEDTKTSPNRVAKGQVVGFHQDAPGLEFLLHDETDHLSQFLLDYRGTFPEGHFVADLVEIARCFGIFPVEPPRCQAVVGQALEGGFDLPLGGKGRQVHHDADPQSGPDVGGTCRQVAEPGVVGVRNKGGDLAIEFVEDLVDFSRLKPRFKGLKPQMILLVDHHGCLQVGPDDHRAGVPAMLHFLADKARFLEKGGLDRGNVTEGELEVIFKDLTLFQGIQQGFKDLDGDALGGVAGEGMPGDIAGQSHPGRHHHVIAWGGFLQPMGIGTDNLGGKGHLRLFPRLPRS